MQRFTEFDFGVSWVMGFFHQDWCHDGPTAADVVAKNLADVDDEYVLAVRRDAQTLLDGLPSKTLEVLWDAGADYLPSFEQIGEGAQWTRTVVALCDARLSTKAGARPLAGADVEDGVAQLDAVLAEIQEAWFLEADVRAALVDCARRCTPELAFRLFAAGHDGRRCQVSDPGAVRAARGHRIGPPPRRVRGGLRPILG
ncbi:hypothetical protein ACQPXS_44455 [Streptomyces sp. CA-142005]|uniref:hypothetical protein n=1 Tax=Streptomyces sp. CA-142005 TaxID=3240052 RepID=UPI003D8D146A